jgi:hypothetical protein
MMQINATFIRPVETESTSGARGVALEIHALDEAQYLVVLSGEGLQVLLQEIQAFLQENPHLAEMKSRPRQ